MKSTKDLQKYIDKNINILIISHAITQLGIENFPPTEIFFFYFFRLFDYLLFRLLNFKFWVHFMCLYFN